LNDLVVNVRWITIALNDRYFRLWVPAFAGTTKFVEAGSGRIGYAMTEAALSEASGGAKWNPDPSFSVRGVC
jgi:hypothetical protein